jgi:hypothetical protein
VKVWENTFQENVPRKQAGLPILTSDAVNYKCKLDRREKVVCSILIKDNIHRVNNNY